MKIPLFDVIIVWYKAAGVFMANRDVIIEKIIKCPVCESDVYISEDKKSLFCKGQRRHCFDFSSDGYLSLSRQGTGDSKQAIAARRAFLSKDYYFPLAQIICEVAQKHAGVGATVLDAGCGEGYYTNKIAERFGFALGFDLSKFGVAAGAKAARRQGINNTFYATGSVFELPVKDGSVDCLVNIFAPCAESEYMRVLKNGGTLIVVGAGKDHLMGLKRALYDSTYENRERADLPTVAEMVERLTHKFEIEVNGQDDVESLFSMTPYYWRTSESDKEKLLGIEQLKTEVEFEIYVYKKAQ